MFRWFEIVATTILALATLRTVLSISYVNAENSSLPASQSSSLLFIGQEQDELHEMLNTEKVLIATLRHYIETQEHKLNFLKSKTNEIRHIHDGVTDREKHLYNPINALTILKRFTSDWKSLKSYAEDYLKTEDLTKNYTQQTTTLTFPTDEDYDAALINLLRIQDMYQLEPQRLAVGEVNGVKLGSEMTWSDCFEIGLKSSKKGYQTYAKYWMETALEKLPNSHNNINNDTHEATTQRSTKPLQDDYAVQAKLEIMKALLNAEYKLGNVQEALKIANEMLELQPKQKNVKKAKKKMENELKYSKVSKNYNPSNKVEQKYDDKQKKKRTKTVAELLIEEICREASSIQNSKQIHTASSSFPSWNPTSPLTPSACAFVTNNLAFLLMQPLNVELLSLDPYIVIYHNVLSDRKIEELKDFVVEGQDETFQFTKIGQKKMRQINNKLHYIHGHYEQNLYDDWQVQRFNFENLMELEKLSMNYEYAQQAKLLFNLQQPLMGGAVIFPQLELSINLPRGALLYFSKLNEFHAPDYRSNYHVCPVISGSQITATTSIKII